jgi:hypothetical protein
MRRLFKIWDSPGGKEVRIDNVSDMTETVGVPSRVLIAQLYALMLFQQLGLLVISRAGFGRRISWDLTDDKIPEGHQMSFSHTLRAVSKNMIIR